MDIRGNALDLFAGIGGMTLAAENAGLQIVGAVGTSVKEAEVYQYNFGQKSYIVTGAAVPEFSFEELPDADYILGSIPYFSYNITRPRERSTSARKKYWEMEYFCDLLRIKLPKGFAVMLSGCLERDLYDLIERISQCGYCVYWQYIDSRLVAGMPVYDKRIYLVGIRQDYHICFTFPKISNGYAYSLAELMQKEDADPKLFIDPSKIDMDTKAEIYNYRYVRERPDERGQKPKYTADRYIRYGTWNPPVLHDGQKVRKISIRELARTKFFPDEFAFDGMSYSAAYQAIGKSVNVYVATQVIRQLCMLLEDHGVKHNPASRSKESVTEQPQSAALPDEKKLQRFKKAERESERADEKRTVSERKESTEICESDGQEKIEAHEETADQNETKQKIFLSYCQRDTEVANLIEKKLRPFINDDFYISRDIRDVHYRDSFKKYMDSVRAHEYVMMIISDSYLKSVNCMYEVLEAFKDKDFGSKILFFVLSEEDRQYYHKEVPAEIAANIYTPRGQAQYTLYWQGEAQKIREEIEQIIEPVHARGLSEELAKISKIEIELPDFFAYFSDAKGVPLKTHLQTNFQELRNIIYKDVTSD